MKKQLFTLALLTLGYIASSQSMAVALMAHMNKIDETMAAGTTQKVRGVDAYIISQEPKVAGETVLTITKIVSGPDKDKFEIASVKPGLAKIVIKKRKNGHTNKFHMAEHDITVTGAKNKSSKRVTDRDGLVVESVQSDIEYNDEGIEVDEIDLDSETTNSASDMEMDAYGHPKDDVFSDV